ncbi:GNAT family N-acetyltransferase [Microbacterium sp. ASV49]|uniref:GNAT family N-acetyltransferase n=1 Tax=Microbacterium candidum TaxID=3041922 RepID=A0ABT7MTF8_9MICO|nr:GNAT family N-acetyltransferase [Microbacterium sp. ASV49]MDL9977732.1 GNAT family N-acetyltransferase [Microbacterium sp. ASV49]
MIDGIEIRRASAADAPAVLQMADGIIEWFVSMGNVSQWGTEPWSSSQKRIARVTEALGLPDAWVAEHPDLGIVGVLVVGDAMEYVPAATEPEVYVRLLLASRDERARGIGRRLMAFADERARAAGVERLRVDCYGGGTGDLVKFYESCGYDRIQTFDIDGWPGQLLGRTLQDTVTAVRSGR